MMPPSKLEALVLEIIRDQGAEGALLVLPHHNERAQLLAMFPPGAQELPAMLRRLADEIEEGNGMKLGNHLKTFHA